MHSKSLAFYIKKTTSSAFWFFVGAILRIWKLFSLYVLGIRCRYSPTCSENAVLSVKQYGIKKGLYLAFKQILCCHPLSKK